MPSSLPPFTCIGAFEKAHERPINTVKISSRNRYLLSGGDDGFLRVWDLNKLDNSASRRRPIQSISTQGSGPVSSATWIERSGNSSVMFAFGTSGGRTFVYSWDRVNSTFKVVDFSDLPPATRVDDLAYDPTFSRLAIGSPAGVHLYNVAKNGKLEKTPLSVAPTPEVTISRVLFMDRGSVIVVTYVDNHKCIAFRINPWTNQWDESLLTRIGYSAIGPDNHMAVTNLYSGVDILPIPPRVPVHHFPHPILLNRPLQVTFVSRDVVVFGSEDGYITVWNWHISETRQLIHSKRVGLSTAGVPVQVVDANTHDGEVLIASAISDYYTPQASVSGLPEFSIKVWTHEIVEETEPLHERSAEERRNASRGDDHPPPSFTSAQVVMIALVCLLGQSLVAHAPHLLRWLVAFIEHLKLVSRGEAQGPPEEIPTVIII
ncbi:WD40-repeat-containing domain protein [Coprinopsis sp. MPI-PUGE-AT-0042]|nr:WD40-repeat-containing domain protein [Coprinopsis sp. MPI-PUGE-AT-0042]